MKLTSRLPPRAAALVVIALLVAACGGGTGTPAGTDITVEAAPVPTGVAPVTTGSTIVPSTTAPPSTVPPTSAATTSTVTTTTLISIDVPALLDAYCTVCHGADLQGGTGPALTAGGHAGDHGIDDLIEVITNGRGEMPAWGDVLTLEEITALVHHIGELQEHG